MKRRVLAMLTAAMLMLSGCSAAKTQETEEREETIIVYQALPLPEIYMDIPESFEVTSSQFYEQYYIHDDASIIITEDTEGPFPSTYDYSISALVQYENIASSMEVLSQDSIQAKNCSVQILEFNYTLGEDDAVQMGTMVGFVSDGDSMFIITCKSDQSTYASHQQEFRTVMKSVMLTKTGR